MIEQLESRTLLSVSSDASAISSAAGSVESTFFAVRAAATADVKTLLADIKRTKASAAAKGAVGSLKSHTTADLNIVENKGKAIFKAVAPDVKRLFVDFEKLQANPTKTSLQSKVNSDITKLNAAGGSAKEALFGDDIQAVATVAASELTQLAGDTTDAQTQTDISNAQSNIAAADATLATNATTFFSAVSQLAIDAAA